ncbi:MAG: helix-hairpin-helix domain-containing protein [Bacteroidales bacterium]|nr:helix-hairpin-helix domain-containing protein [Bacteroidales bacterium]
MEEGKRQKTSKKPTSSFTTGAIALVFLIIGFEVALFVHKAAVTRLVADRDRPDTVYIVERPKPLAEASQEEEEEMDTTIIRRSSNHSPEAVQVREKAARRPVETFRFNPNTASLEDLMRLGFSEKQAQSILNYRAKGGRYRRPSDFAKSFVVADSVFDRLKPYIDIPRIDINKADSAAFETLPGIGPYFAAKMVSYRASLRGYSTPEQLMDIYHFDREKYDGLKDLITCSKPEPYPIWTLSEVDLARHPYISKDEAHSIVLYRTHQPKETWTLEGLQKAGVLSEEHHRQLSRCILAKPATD